LALDEYQENVVKVVFTFPVLVKPLKKPSDSSKACHNARLPELYRLGMPAF
jgi:hypothetical protein